MNAPATAIAGIATLAPDEIDPSPSNPRKTFSGIEELAENVKAKGVLVPICVRPKGDRFELVFGERRLRAARLAGLEVIPAMIRDLNDEEVLEQQLIENSKREDVHPLEEAEGYRELHEKYGYTADEIAAKVGKSRRTVYERMQLCKVVEPVKRMAFEGKLPASHLVLVARIPTQLQERAAKELAGLEKHGTREAVSLRDAIAHLRNGYMLRLEDVPWDLGDEQLVPSAGSCGVCPKRTANQRELFADVAKTDDLCTDSICFQKKQDAVWKLKVASAEQGGQQVLPEKEAKKLFTEYGGVQYGADFVPLDREEWVGDKRKSVKSLLGKNGPPTVLARDPHTGKIHELAPADAVKKAVKAALPKERATTKGGAVDDKWRKQQEKDRQEREAADAIAGGVIGALVAKVEKADLKPAVWKFLALTAAHDDNVDLLEPVIDRRAWNDGEDLTFQELGARLRKRVEKMSTDECRGFVFEAVLAMGSTWGSGRIDKLKDGSIALGVGYDKLAATAKTEVKAAKEAQKQPATPPPAKPATAAKPKKGKR